MEHELGKYYIRRFGNLLYIYRCVLDLLGKKSLTIVDSEPCFYDYEEARKRMYELNGWNYKPRKR